MAQAPVGYDDTPQLVGQPWKVHDIKRPHPPVVTPGTFSSQTAVGDPPGDAAILFDGTGLSEWVALKGGDAGWKVENGYMEVVKGAGDIVSKKTFGDCQLHLEFACPSEVKGDSQGRGNSGVFVMGLYEIQVLDGYDNPTYADGLTGGVYGQWPPLVNACRKPGEWQMYDIVWIAPRFAGDQLITPACATVFLNGVLQHNAKILQGPTQHKKTTKYEVHPDVGPLKLQDHSNPVRFRNIWYRPLTAYDQVVE
jgi:hypothetical protein